MILIYKNVKIWYAEYDHFPLFDEVYQRLVIFL